MSAFETENQQKSKSSNGSAAAKPTSSPDVSTAQDTSHLDRIFDGSAKKNRSHAAGKTDSPQTSDEWDMVGLQPDLKDMLLNTPLGEFNIPIIVHGKVTQDTYAPGTSQRKTSQLRIARNEGGAISVGAERGSLAAELLSDRGGGDSFDGARALFAHVDQRKLSKVE